MDSNSLISEGFALMGFGMGFVFVFLTLLVLMTGLMSRLVTRFAPEPEPVAARRPTPAPASAADQQQLIAVITAAIHQYRAKHKK
jgi:oxaloacetate decarboxylase gamma subunit